MNMRDESPFRFFQAVLIISSHLTKSQGADKPLWNNMTIEESTKLFLLQILFFEYCKLISAELAFEVNARDEQKFSEPVQVIDITISHSASESTTHNEKR